MTNITFEKVNHEHKEIIFSWLEEPHVKEFWDNTPEHKEDIINFIDGRKTPSTYCSGKYIYWIAKDNNQPFAMLMTILETKYEDIGELKLANLSKTGHTYGIDYMIGNKNFFGKGYGARTLIDFINFIPKNLDPKADTFLIDPANDNPRAKHIYMKAGFDHIADFVMNGDCSGAGKLHHLLIKKLLPKIDVVQASKEDYQSVQKMTKFYFYDLSKSYTITPSEDFNNIDFKNYFEDADREAYLIKVYDKIAGFVLLNKATTNKNSTWNIGEFFIIGKFQGMGIGKKAAKIIWDKNPCNWEVSVIPENKQALNFWEKSIADYTDYNFNKETKLIDFDQEQPQRIIFSFKSKVS